MLEQPLEVPQHSEVRGEDTKATTPCLWEMSQAARAASPQRADPSLWSPPGRTDAGAGGDGDCPHSPALGGPGSGPPGRCLATPRSTHSKDTNGEHRATRKGACFPRKSSSLRSLR